MLIIVRSPSQRKNSDVTPIVGRNAVERLPTLQCYQSKVRGTGILGNSCHLRIIEIPSLYVAIYSLQTKQYCPALASSQKSRFCLQQTLGMQAMQSQANSNVHIQQMQWSRTIGCSCLKARTDSSQHVALLRKASDALW